MIDFKNQTVSLLGKTQPIKGWAVYFLTEKGTFKSLDDIKDCEHIVPVPVALGETIFDFALPQIVRLDEQATLPTTGQDSRPE